MNYVFYNLKEEATFEDFRKEYEKHFGEDYYLSSEPEDIPSGKIVDANNAWVRYDQRNGYVTLWEDDDDDTTKIIADISKDDLKKMSATEVWELFVDLRGYREPNGELEDDAFFDDEDICKKYNVWDSESNSRNYDDITNSDFREMLDETDTAEYIKYMTYCIEETAGFTIY